MHALRWHRTLVRTGARLMTTALPAATEHTRVRAIRLVRIAYRVHAHNGQAAGLRNKTARTHLMLLLQLHNDNNNSGNNNNNNYNNNNNNKSSARALRTRRRLRVHTVSSRALHRTSRSNPFHVCIMFCGDTIL